MIIGLGQSGETTTEGSSLPGGTNITAAMGQDVGLANPSITSQMSYMIGNGWPLIALVVGGILLLGGKRR